VAFQFTGPLLLEAHRSHQNLADSAAEIGRGENAMEEFAVDFDRVVEV